MSREQRDLRSDLSELIAENFGANATYVENLLARWRSNPALVDESWRTYFEELIGANGDAATTTTQPADAKPEARADGAAAAPPQTKQTKPLEKPTAPRPRTPSTHG